MPEAGYVDDSALIGLFDQRQQQFRKKEWTCDQRYAVLSLSPVTDTSEKYNTTERTMQSIFSQSSKSTVSNHFCIIK